MITDKNVFCKNKNSINNYENILKLAIIEVEWNDVDVFDYENDWETEIDYEIDDESKN